MTTYELLLTTDELRLLEAALKSYLDDFGHDEADTLGRLKALLAKLPRGIAVPDLQHGQTEVSEL
jgi:hypothetical protein